MKKRINSKQIFLFIIFFIFLSIFIYSSINIFTWFKDNKNTDTQVEMINKKVEIKEIKNNINTEIIEPQEKEPITSPYWKYLETPLIDVNFEELKNINTDTVGWINIPGTNVNYPFVQTKDNNYYLTHSFDKSYNKAGWLFLDYRNNLSNLNKNTIIYGHARIDQTMLGSLTKTLENNWYNNINNHIIRLSTEKENSLWQIFSIYTIPNTNDYIQTDFTNDIEYLNFLTKLRERSIYKFDTSISPTDNILTTSTCYKKNDRLVIHAKLIKKEAK